MSEIAIHVENLGKRYQLGLHPQGDLREAVAGALRAPWHGVRRLVHRHQGTTGDADAEGAIWAVRDVSFDVEQGEVVGIVGRNGAGKSTLLKILARITEPTTGLADISGRVGSLLEVGTGFHPELTGRENVLLNGAILGMSSAEVAARFDEIVDFAEVHHVLDTPVKHYSSGLAMRLAFAVAAHLQPEILLVDEVLAVGDASFQKKCLGKMGEVAGEGRTVIFVSHNMAAMRALCTRALLLEQGEITMAGDPQEVIATYLSSTVNLERGSLELRSDRLGNGALRVIEAALWNRHGAVIPVAQSGDEVQLALRYEAQKDRLNNINMSVTFFDVYGQILFVCNNVVAGQHLDFIDGQGYLVCQLPHLPLAPGLYSFNLYCTVNGVVADHVRDAGKIMVESGDFFGSGRLPPAGRGSVLVPNVWRTATDPGPCPDTKAAGGYLIRA